jgi:hypothetical protein
MEGGWKGFVSFLTRPTDESWVMGRAWMRGAALICTSPSLSLDTKCSRDALPSPSL